jgi:hypothetical protein
LLKTGTALKSVQADLANLQTLQAAEAAERMAKATLETAAAYPGMSIEVAKQLDALNAQLVLAQQLTGLGEINVQYYLRINELRLQGKTLEEQVAIATAQRAVALAQVETAAQQQLRTLREEYEIITAISESEKGRIRAAQEYKRLTDKGVSPETAGQIASQMQANARATEDAASAAQNLSGQMGKVGDTTESWSVQMDNANDAINRVGNSIDRAGDEMAALVAASNRLRAALSFVPTITLGLGGGTSSLQQSNQGGYSQFNPGGYTSTKTIDLAELSKLLTEQAMGNVRTADQFMEALTKSTAATQDNTAATQTQTDVLSPFYSSDPRSTHLGFRAFAGGGIMTAHGELPLKQYAGGGLATSPQVAVFGEGSTPEAYVPAPAGKIPVDIRMPANSNQRPVNVTINVMGNADANTVAALKSTAFQQAQTMRRAMS